MRACQLLFCLLLFAGSTRAQLSKGDCYRFTYPPGASRLSPADEAFVRALADSFRHSESEEWVIEGHADSSGRAGYNLRLSEKRALALRDILLRAGVRADRISVSFYGSSQPLSNGQSPEARARNRRASLCHSTLIDIPPTTIRELYQKLATAPDTFLIDPRRDTLLRCRRGTLLLVKARTFAAGRDCGARLLVREDLSRGAMIRDNLSTMADSTLLETGGMLWVRGEDCLGRALSPAKDLVVFLPTDTVHPDARLFEGQRVGHDSTMNWAISNDPRLSTLSSNDVGYCSFWLYCGGFIRPRCTSCPLFFCGIGRGIGGLFRASVRRRAQLARDCPQRQRNYDTLIARKARAALAAGAAPPQTPQPRCQSFAELFKQYGVDNYEALLLAMNKPLLDSFHVTTMEALRDTLQKVKVGKIEAAYNDRSIGFDDLKYYVFSTRRLGWINVDCFADLRKRQLTGFSIDLPVNEQTDCKLVLRERRAIFSPTHEAGRYTFRGVPKREQATIVALRYANGQPELALLDIVIGEGPYALTFRQVSLEELKAELARWEQ